jgi:hypothetical protein
VWNDVSLAQHCKKKKKGQIRYFSNAEYTKGRDREELTLAQRVSIAKLPVKSTGRLPEHIKIAIGMKVLVTWNLATEADLTNGALGEIVDIILDIQEEGGAENGGKLLKYPPAMILFKAYHHTFWEIPRHTRRPHTHLPNLHRALSKWKCQYHKELALDGAYAFTEFRAQGQTLEYVIIDIGKPPTGALSPFNAYAALSRSRGRHSIRLLRDFNDKLFTVHSSEALRDEDDRLEALDIATKEKYELGGFAYTWQNVGHTIAITRNKDFQGSEDW